MSESLASLYDPYFDDDNSVVPAVVGPRSTPPTYMPRAEITFPAFAALSESPPARNNEPLQPPPPPPPPPQDSGGDVLGGLMSMFGGGMGGMGGGAQQGGAEGGDKFGFGSTPFVPNADSDNVFDSIGNIFEDGGDTSDWIDVGYNVARFFGGFAEGGLVEEEPMAFAGGGVVALEGGGKVAIGPGGGLDDLIPTSIDGRRAAALSDGEFVIPADVVSMMGDGSSNAGARRLYDLVRQVRDNKTGTTRQAGPLPVGDILKRSLS
jgi:hypothetical protein